MVQKKKKTFKVEAVKERGSSSDGGFSCTHHHSRPGLLGAVVLSRSGRELSFPTRCRFLLGLVKLSRCTFRVCICLVCREGKTLAATKVRVAKAGADACRGPLVCALV